MASSYPGAIDSLAINHTDNTSEVIHAQTDNDQSDAINHIETELGVTPKDVYADVATRLSVLELLQFNVKNLTTYTLVLADRSKVLSMINAGASTVTIPPSSSVNFPIGTQIMVRQGPAAGTVTIVAGVGVTIESRNSSFSAAGTLAWITLIKVGADTWDVIGDLA